MKTTRRIFALLLILTLCVFSSAALAEEVTYNANGIFTIRYDDQHIAMDNQSYLEECTDVFTWMFMLYDQEKDVIVDVSMEYYEEYEDLALFSADAQTRQAYVDSMLDAYADMGIRLLDTFSISEIDIPFYLFYAEDENGGYLVAETVVYGYAIDFTAYRGEDTEVDEATLDVLTQVLDTFEPIL